MIFRDLWRVDCLWDPASRFPAVAGAAVTAATGGLEGGPEIDVGGLLAGGDGVVALVPPSTEECVPRPSAQEFSVFTLLTTPAESPARPSSEGPPPFSILDWV